MKLITIDFETYYDREFSLSKITTEEYVRGLQFETIGVSVKVNGGTPQWFSGDLAETTAWLKQFDWENSAALAHNAMFDGAILNWIYDIRPRFWFDTLCMGRAVHGTEVGGSLKALAERYGLGEKGTEVVAALGKRRASFHPDDLARYGGYCINDVELTYALFYKLLDGFPKKELHLIDLTLRMFTEPVLELDEALLYKHKEDIRERKAKLFASIGGTAEEAKDMLMSNPKFAEMLTSFGVVYPKKVSAATGKITYAFAKTDEHFKALLEHPDLRVQTLVAARLGVKSTLEETRTQQFLGIVSRGAMPVPLKYYAAHTGRWGGSDKINLQNLPSRGVDGNTLKLSIKAPEGHTIIDADSAQIEARVLAWLAGHTSLVQSFTDREDVYKKMASAIYGKPESDITKDERFVGKVTILGAGYGMGGAKFQAALKNFGAEVELEEAKRIISVYRSANDPIVQLWREAQNVLIYLCNKENATLGKAGVLTVVPDETAIRLPSGLLMRYTDLKHEQGENGLAFSYKARYGRNFIYGGKIIENVCQGIARCVIGEQMLRVSKKYKVVLTVHDAIACVVPDAQVPEARAHIEDCMRWIPAWAEGLPVNCESGFGKSYGEC